MGGKPSLKISYNEKHQMTSLLASESLDSRTAIRLQIILELANGKSKKDIAKECGVSPKTVWKTEHRYLVFGLDGILDDAPRIGFNRIISGDTANEVLKYPLLNDPTDSAQWTGTELARRLGITKSTIYNYLNHWSIRLDDSTTLQEACIKDGSDPEEVVGLFISPSISITIFACKDGRSSAPSGIMSCMMSPHEKNLSSFYRRTCNSVIGLLEDARMRVSSRYGRGLESTDVSRFMSLTDGGMRNCSRLLLATGSTSSKAWKKVEMYCTYNPHFHLEVREEDWLEFVHNVIRRPEMMNKSNALRLENLEYNLEEWLTGIGCKTGTFFWMDPFK